MPWQRLVADVGCEIDPASGLPAYSEVIVTVPRQSGKTTLFVSWQIHRCTNPRWAQPQRTVFTAQSGADARKKWLDELFPMIRASKKIKPLYAKIYEGLGNEAIRWKNESMLRLLATAVSSGHSQTLHQAVMDEIWNDEDDRREQGLRPTMITIPDKQILVCSTAGTASSVVYNRKVALGRKAVAEDSGRGIAFFEYSAPEGWDPASEEGWFEFMPALCPAPPCRCGVDDGGWRHSTTPDAIRTEQVVMEPAEFARAYGNIPTPSDAEQPIDPVKFAMLASRRPRIDAERMFFIDMQGVRSGAIGQGFLAGDRPFAELAYSGEGTDWLLPVVKRLYAKHPGAIWGLEKAGAASVYLNALNEIGIEPELFTRQDIGRAHVHLQKLVNESGMRYNAEDSDKLLSALGGAVRKDIGEGLWTWSYRKSTGNLPPLISIAGALWLLETQPPMPMIYSGR